MSDILSDPSDAGNRPSDNREPPPWTIRGVAPEIRNALLAAAKREGQTMGEWISRHGRDLILSDRQRARAPVPIPQPSDTSDAGQTGASLAELVTLAKEIAGTEGAPKGLAPLAFGLVRDRLKAMKAATRPTKPSGMSDQNHDNV